MLPLVQVCACFGGHFSTLACHRHPLQNRCAYNFVLFSGNRDTSTWYLRLFSLDKYFRCCLELSNNYLLHLVCSRGSDYVSSLALVVLCTCANDSISKLIKGEKVCTHCKCMDLSSYNNPDKGLGISIINTVITKRKRRPKGLVQIQSDKRNNEEGGRSSEDKGSAGIAARSRQAE